MSCVVAHILRTLLYIFIRFDSIRRMWKIRSPRWQEGVNNFNFFGLFIWWIVRRRRRRRIKKMRKLNQFRSMHVWTTTSAIFFFFLFHYLHIVTPIKLFDASVHARHHWAGGGSRLCVRMRWFRIDIVLHILIGPFAIAWAEKETVIAWHHI